MTRLPLVSAAVAVAVAVAFGCVLVAEAAQRRPDFSGAWKVPDSSREQAGGSPGSGWGASFTIIQDEETLTVERVFFTRGDLQPPLKFRYALDGSETRNTVMMGRGIQTTTSTARWDGDHLVISTQHTVPDAGDGESVECNVTRVVSLLSPPPGRLGWPPSLLVETTRCSVGESPPSTTRVVYRKN